MNFDKIKCWVLYFGHNSTRKLHRLGSELLEDSTEETDPRMLADTQLSVRQQEHSYDQEVLYQI